MTNPTNSVIGFPRWTEDLSVAASCPAWQTDWPAANALTLPMTQVARSVDCTLANTKAFFTLSQLRAVSFIGIFGHNLTTNAKYRLKLFSDTILTSLAYDSGWNDVWPISFPFGSVPWGDVHFFGGKFTPEEIATYTAPLPILVPILIPTLSWSIEFDDQTNPAGFVELSEIECTESWILGLDFSPGLEFGFASESILTKAMGGGIDGLQMPEPREWVGSVDEMDHTETMTRWFELQHSLSTVKPFPMWINPSDDANLIRNCALVRLTAMNRAKRAYFKNDQTPFQFTEVLV